MANFEDFLKKHPSYDFAIKELFESSMLLAISAQFVYANHGEAMGPVADEILGFVEQTYGAQYISKYISRVNELAMLQERFDANPSAATLGDQNVVVDPDAYALGLLLSIVFTNHRFELIRELSLFLNDVEKSIHRGTLLSIGFGTGYELKIASQVLAEWHVEAYDTASQMMVKAHQLLDFFGISKDIFFGGYFPLHRCPDEVRGHYDAIVLSEVLEHLAEPAKALETLRDCLRDEGRMFATMAINIAQEDHLFLYPTINSCREQIKNCGLVVAREWISPQTIFTVPEDREEGFTRGNYIAVLEKQKIS
jgi:SAM-dependent methyltransferase